MNPEYTAKKEQMDSYLPTLIASFLPEDHPLREAMEYAVAAPGKRIRGVLTLAFCERLGVPDEQALPFAAALEMIHAYSLVHDDMPEMDNDDFRRGLPTCHKRFGSAMALLAGDGILNFSMEYLLSKKKLYQPERFLAALEVLYSAAGVNGMLRGQAIDMMSENREITLDELCFLHRCKTGALLLAPIQIAEALSGQKNENYVNYSTSIGIAFQIKDDILDVEGNAELLGKETGKDREEQKSTFVSILGLEAAHAYLKSEINAARENVINDRFLLWLAEYIESREK